MERDAGFEERGAGFVERGAGFVAHDSESLTHDAEYMAHDIEKRNSDYYLRMQIALVCALLLLIALFRFWPFNPANHDRILAYFDEERIPELEWIRAASEVVVERAMPPVPRTESTLPRDEVVDMVYDLELDMDLFMDWAPLAEKKLEEEEAPFVANPQRGASVRRIVEPVMPADARRDGIRVRLLVQFLVDSEGRVEEVDVVRMEKYNIDNGRFEEVESTGYGFREVVLAAARQWLFHPARHEEANVRSAARHSFTFEP